MDCYRSMNIDQIKKWIIVTYNAHTTEDAGGTLNITLMLYLKHITALYRVELNINILMNLIFKKIILRTVLCNSGFALSICVRAVPRKNV